MNWHALLWTAVFLVLAAGFVWGLLRFERAVVAEVRPQILEEGKALGRGEVYQALEAARERQASELATSPMKQLQGASITIIEREHAPDGYEWRLLKRPKGKDGA